MIAGLFALFSCQSKLGKADSIDLSSVPVQQVRDMFVVDTENGRLKMRMEGALMERYESDTSSFELFPEGFYVYIYDEQGDLQTTISADKARHTKNKNGNELWMVTGNVVTKNLKNREVMESDTIYWDRTNEVYWTDSYVKMYSPDGFVQGYGMRSNQREHNSVIQRPFNSYAFVEGEQAPVDTANFIGPVLKK